MAWVRRIKNENVGITPGELSPGATVVWDASAIRKARMEITSGPSPTLSAPAGLMAGEHYTLAIINSDSSAHTITWDSSFVDGEGAALESISIDAGGMRSYNFVAVSSSILQLTSKIAEQTGILRRMAYRTVSSAVLGFSLDLSAELGEWEDGDLVEVHIAGSGILRFLCLGVSTTDSASLNIAGLNDYVFEFSTGAVLTRSSGSLVGTIDRVIVCRPL